MPSRSAPVTVAACLLAASTVLAAERLPYPAARRVQQADDYHGVRVADPYRWLEQDVRQSKEVADWVAEQNRVTFAFLDAIPQRAKLQERFTELWDFPKYSPPFKEGGRYFFFRNDGLQNQSVLYVADSLGGEARVLLDPNTWSKDGTVALAAATPSRDGRLLAYAVAEAGSDWNVWRVVEVDSGKLLADELRWIKFSDVAWTGDGRGFYYSRYPQPKKGREFQGELYNNRLYFHRLGTPQSADTLVYARPEHPDWRFDGRVTDNGRYLVITTGIGTDDKYRVSVKDLSKPEGGSPLELIDNFDNEYTLADSQGSTLYFQTDLEAPRRRVIAIDVDRPAKENWREVVPQAEQTLIGAQGVGGLLVAQYLKDVRPLVKVFSHEGRLVREVEFPGIGDASGFQGRQSDAETFYSFSSFATPPSIYRYDVTTGKSTLWRRPEVKFNPDDFEVRQVFYPSKDGTRVPMFVAHRKGIKLDGSNPALLYGYGGFNISLPPIFAISRVIWMEMGGVYAQPNLRGGGEYGEAWHKAGTRLQKQNVFDDFIAAAEWLVANRYTRPERLAIQGGSNGGLLVGAVMTQRPDLFGACLPAVGVMDMLRFHLFTGGRLWTDDYGSADDPAEFKALLAYSPYQNIKPGTCYPPTLITTADTDDRVVPAHSFKFAAALQHAQSCAKPVLIRIETRAGHGAGKPTSKRIAEAADQWAFLVKVFGMKP